MTGKNFSANNLGQRRKGDFYETPYSVTERLLDAVDDIDLGSVLEPAAGQGAIVRVLKDRGHASVTSYDLSHGTSFLDETQTFDTVLTNPPFSLAKEFIDTAQRVAQKHIFLLLPLSYLHGKQRHDAVFRHYSNLKTVYVFTRYPMLGDALREDRKYRTGMMVYAWFHWDKSYNGLPSIDWLDNDSDILRRGD